MSLFLFKPHVVGPKGDITTPDVIIDKLYVSDGDDLAPVPIGRISSEVKIPVESGLVVATPAFVLTAIGGGTLFSPAMLVNAKGDPLRTAEILMARKAWRHANLAEHEADVTMAASGKDATLGSLPGSGELIAKLTGGGDALPRGIAILVAVSGLAAEVTAPARVEMQLRDPRLDRELTHRLDLVSVADDRWEDRPGPRYTFGPQHGDLQHYI